MSLARMNAIRMNAIRMNPIGMNPIRMSSSRTVCRSSPVLIAILLLAASLGHAGNPRGHLVIIGGGERTEPIMRRFVELAGGGEKAKIVVIPLASGDARAAGAGMVAEFNGLGVRNVSFLLFNKTEALTDTVAAKFDGATGVYFTGGDQVRVTRVIVGTPVQQKLLQLYRDGAVIGGTSAGAAIMSKVMITGEELINKDTNNIFVAIQKGNVETVEGLGFLDDVIIDQHFVKRKRLNRLISVVLEHPGLPGIGIDESTALIVMPDRSYEVMGEGTIVVLDARVAKEIHADPRGNLAARNILMHVYCAGEKFETGATKRGSSPAGQ
jgi:cyanophycinase